jgi:ATP-dependent phosphoenolpyruvate carboxykinase
MNLYYAFNGGWSCGNCEGRIPTRHSRCLTDQIHTGRLTVQRLFANSDSEEIG